MVNRTDAKAAPQVDKFRKLARELDCDTDEAAFKAKLVKIARAPRQPTEKKS